ncbi:hypothetical protein FS837_006185 [Tulasnella sp. UAMH 9824]|nr:hypothetical protein FS837_006185 [Tulasnella sp. UAMH 9824]
MQATREFIIRVAACAKVANGEDAWVPTLIPRWLTNAGFQNLQEDVRDMPVGPWMGSAPMRELGNLVQPMYIQFVEAMKPALLNLPGAAVEDVNDLVDGVREELESEANTGWSIPVHIVTASKA